MKKFIFGFMAIAALLPTPSLAQDNSPAQKCVSYAKSKLSQNPDIQNIFSQIKLENDAIEENKFDDRIGTQNISTEMVISLRSDQEVFGTLLCLMDGEKPLYYFFNPA